MHGVFRTQTENISSICLNCLKLFFASDELEDYSTVLGLQPHYVYLQICCRQQHVEHTFLRTLAEHSWWRPLLETSWLICI